MLACELSGSQGVVEELGWSDGGKGRAEARTDIEEKTDPSCRVTAGAVARVGMTIVEDC